MRLILGDCHQHLDAFADCDAIISDPPWGCRNDCDYTRFTKGRAKSRNFHEGIIGDDQPFDPSPWLDHEHVALFGFNHFAARLPVGTVCVWIKKRQFGKFLSDAELIWLKGGHGVYCHSHIWNGFDRESERGEKTLHPTQKPIQLLEWLMKKMKLPDGCCVGDPFMGCGSTGVAAKQLGFDFVGCEVEPTYFEIAKHRIRG